MDITQKALAGISAYNADGEGFEPSVDRKAHNGFETARFRLARLTAALASERTRRW